MNGKSGGYSFSKSRREDGRAQTSADISTSLSWEKTANKQNACPGDEVAKGGGLS